MEVYLLLQIPHYAANEGIILIDIYELEHDAIGDMVDLNSEHPYDRYYVRRHRVI